MRDERLLFFQNKSIFRESNLICTLTKSKLSVIKPMVIFPSQIDGCTKVDGRFGKFVLDVVESPFVIMPASFML